MKRLFTLALLALLAYAGALAGGCSAFNDPIFFGTAGNPSAPRGDFNRR